MAGTKHLIQCHCMLPQYRRKEIPVFHQFVVYSKIDEDDKIKERLSKCNNCGAIHRILDLCKSEIAINLEETDTVITKDDVIESLPEKVAKILSDNHADLATYENVEDVIFDERWGEKIVISRQKINGEKQNLKIIEFKSEEKFRVYAEIISTFTSGE